MKWAILWLVLAAVFASGFGSLNVPLFERLTSSGVQTQATVVELTPRFHNTVRYQYQVDGTKFEGQRQSWRPNPPLDQISVGQSLVAYYDPLSPRRSVLGDPGPMLTNELISIGLVVLIMPTFVVIALMHKQRQKMARV